MQIVTVSGLLLLLASHAAEQRDFPRALAILDECPAPQDVQFVKGSVTAWQTEGSDEDADLVYLKGTLLSRIEAKMRQLQPFDNQTLRAVVQRLDDRALLSTTEMKQRFPQPGGDVGEQYLDKLGTRGYEETYKVVLITRFLFDVPSKFSAQPTLMDVDRMVNESLHDRYVNPMAPFKRFPDGTTGLLSPISEFPGNYFFHALPEFDIYASTFRRRSKWW